MAIHDIDLARWPLQSEPKSIYTIGGCYVHQKFSKYQDGDNVSALMQFKNESMAFLLAGRTAPYGYNVETENRYSRTYKKRFCTSKKFCRTHRCDWYS